MISAYVSWAIYHIIFSAYSVLPNLVHAILDVLKINNGPMKIHYNTFKKMFCMSHVSLAIWLLW